MGHYRERTQRTHNPLSGHSGVGKSTLIKAILPDIEIKTGEISTYHNKGMHTTTFSEMFPFRQRIYH
ncbi:GTPase RsgA [Bacteroides uniformis]|uniref:GTPase RsgA n=1 Tax=Bacteroides uniformis TaxID=820 RepID=UPI003978C068